MRRKWEVRRSTNGLGLFAVERLRAGARITPIPGRRVSADEVWDVGGALSDNAFRYGPETFLDPLDGPGRWVNHSCEPNAAVGKRRHELYLFAAREIAAGTEILIDYSTVLGADDIWTMRCTCRTRSCRGRVRNLARIPAVLRQDYLDRRMVPRFIRRTLSSR